MIDPYLLVPLPRASISIGVVNISPTKSFGSQEHSIEINTEILLFMMKLDFILTKDFWEKTITLTRL